LPLVLQIDVLPRFVRPPTLAGDGRFAQPRFTLAQQRASSPCC
jgi:hypothetical protein